MNLRVHQNALFSEGQDYAFASVPPAVPSGASRGCFILMILPSDELEGEESVSFEIDQVDIEAVDEITTVVIASDGGYYVHTCTSGTTITYITNKL